MTSSKDRFETVPSTMPAKFAFAVKGSFIPRSMSASLNENFDSSLNFGKVRSTASRFIERIAVTMFAQVKLSPLNQSVCLMFGVSSGTMNTIDVRTGDLRRVM